MSTHHWIMLFVVIWPIIEWYCDFLAKKEERKQGKRSIYDVSSSKRNTSFPF